MDMYVYFRKLHEISSNKEMEWFRNTLFFREMVTAVHELHENSISMLDIKL